MSELRETLRSVAKRRKLSISQLSALLGYSSATSLSRIMQGNVRANTLADFYTRAQQTLELTEEEKAALDGAVQLRLYGAEALKEREAFRAWLLADRTAPPVLTVTDAEGQDREPFLARYGNLPNLKMEIVNCAYPAFCSAVERLLDRPGTEAVQYLGGMKENADYAHVLMLLQETLHHPNYRCFVDGADTAPEPGRAAGLLGADLLLCSWDGDRGRRSELLTLRDAETAIAVPLRDGEAVSALIRSQGAGTTPLKRDWPILQTIGDYLAYTEDLRELEYNTETWDIKPDLCISYISPRILRAALEEGPIPADQLAPVIDTLAQQHARRYDNMMQKRKATHLLLKKDAMLQFAMTGRTSDHFVGFRPYTPLERMSILSTLLHQQLENRFFHVHFLRDDRSMPDNNLMIYGKNCITMVSRETHYDMNKAYSDVRLDLPAGFMEALQKYYIYVLVKELCVSENESVDFLMSLLSLVNAGGRSASGEAPD